MTLHEFFLAKTVDGLGLYGKFLHYGIVISLVGSAFLIFIYLWRKKRLDLDEEPKFQMMQEDEPPYEGRQSCQTKDTTK